MIKKEIMTQLRKSLLIKYTFTECDEDVYYTFDNNRKELEKLYMTEYINYNELQELSEYNVRLQGERRAFLRGCVEYVK